MEVRALAIDGPLVIYPDVYSDDRGYFFESFNEKEFKEKVANIDFVQDNESMSADGVIRGLHFQKPPFDQAKLVRVVSGAVIDVAVDLRKGSPTYGRYWNVYLSDTNHKQFFIPRGFAHGFAAIKPDTVFQYKCDNFYNKESEGSIRYDDPDIAIPWSNWIHESQRKLSEKDLKAAAFKDFDSPWIYEVTDMGTGC